MPNLTYFYKMLMFIKINTMKPIVYFHLNRFHSFLNELNRLFPLDMDGIRLGIKDKANKSYPEKGETVIILAVKNTEIEKCGAFLPVVAVTSPPHHLSQNEEVLEFKIMDNRRSSSDKLNFIISLSIFENGRIVLSMDGVSFDSFSRTNFIKKEVVVRNYSFLKDYSYVCKLCISIVNTFKSKKITSIPEKESLVNILNSIIHQKS